MVPVVGRLDPGWYEVRYSMKVSGYKIREAVATFELRRSVADREFQHSLVRFPEEKKDSPQEVMKRVELAEKSLAALYATQAHYNTAVTFSVEGIGNVTLGEAVRRVAGGERIVKLWKTAISKEPNRASRFSEEGLDVRKADHVYAERAIDISTATKFATAAQKQVSALRAAIGEANRREIDLNVDAVLFE